MRLRKVRSQIILATGFLFFGCKVTETGQEEEQPKTVTLYTEGIRIAWDYQTRTEGGTDNWHHSTMTVSIGDEQAKNFCRKSKPFDVPDDRFAQWSSLFIKNDTTITVVAATSAYNASHSELFTIDGYVIEEIKAFCDQIEIDGNYNEEAWKRSLSTFLVAYSPTKVYITMS
jgi:hypothetical protein